MVHLPFPFVKKENNKKTNMKQKQKNVEIPTVEQPFGQKTPIHCPFKEKLSA